MNLTEPHCGTDLGLLRTKAVPQRRRLLQDLRPEDLHLGRRARHGGQHHPSGAGPHRGRAGRRQGHLAVHRAEVQARTPTAIRASATRVSCGSIEEKMGIHGNSTCVMNYDEATGYLIGEENSGLKAMFVMMNEARLGVGLQGLSIAKSPTRTPPTMPRTASRAARSPAPKAPDKKADPIIVHPDIRRSLMTMQGLQRGRPRADRCGPRSSPTSPTAPATSKDRQAADDTLGLMTPIIKGVLTDKGFDHAVMAQQVFGGHGYIEEHGMSQFVRDARIAMIYEGANGIQALDLVGRKLGAQWRPRGAGLLQGGRRVLRGKPRRREDGALHQGAEEGPQRPAGRDHVADAERAWRSPTMPALPRPTTCISSAWWRSATCGRGWPRRAQGKLADGADGIGLLREQARSPAATSWSA